MANFGTTYNENLMVNLVAIALVKVLIQKFEYFARLAWKCLFTPFLAVLGVKIGENGKFLNCYLSRNAIIWNRHYMKQTA